MQQVRKLFFELLRLSIGRCSELSTVPTGSEWRDLYDESRRQAVAGICFNGVGITRRTGQAVNLPADLYHEWINLALQIQESNIDTMQKCRELTEIISEDGISSCILKGQSAARYYGPELSSLRQSGDIDIWVDMEPLDAIRWAKENHNGGPFGYHHIMVPLFKGIPVEVHYRPLRSRNLIRNHRLQKLNRDYSSKFLFLPELGFSVVPSSFDAILLTNHIFHHLFSKGVGLRQIMDMYFFLNSIPGIRYEDFQKTMRWLKLDRFAAALMWIMKEVFQLEDNKLACTPDRKEGMFLLDEIMKSGNMGKHDPRNRHFRSESKVVLFIVWVKRGARYLFHYTEDALWNPIGIIWISMWRRIATLKIINLPERH